MIFTRRNKAGKYRQQEQSKTFRLLLLNIFSLQFLFMSTPIHASLQQLHGKAVIAVQFPNTAELNRRFKQLPGARWSQTLGSWHLPDTAEHRKRFGLQPKPPVGKAVVAQIAETNQLAFARMEQQLILQNYSQSTCKTYLVEFAQLLYIIGKVPAESLSYDRLRAYFA
jgi:hypothetical protein